MRKKETRLKEYIWSDLARIVEPSKKNFFCWYFFPRGTVFPYQVWYRILVACKKNIITKYTVGFLAYFMYRHLGFKYGISFDSNINVGKGLKIVHAYGVTINCQSIGENCTIFQNTTFGSDDNNDVPIIGNNVTVYTGSVVVGKIKIGDNSIIGANSFVNKNVPNFVTVAGIPAKVIKCNNKPS